MLNREYQVNEILFWKNRTFTSTTEKTSLSGRFVGVLGEIFYIISKNSSGIYRIDIKVADDWEELAEGTCLEDRLTIVDVNFFVPEARIRFTPTLITASLTAKAWGYPSVFIRGPHDPVDC